MSKLEDQVAEYLDEKQARTSAQTVYQYANILNATFLPWAKREKLAEAAQVNDKAMDRFTVYLRQSNRAKETVRTYCKKVLAFLAWAEVPKGRYMAPRRSQRLRDVLTRQEIDAIERAATDERDRLFIRVLADSGIRVSEALGLRLVDLRENAQTRTYLIRVIGKGDKQRDVPIPGNVYRRLRNYAEANGTDYIFMSKRCARGRQERELLSKSGAEQLVRNLARTAGIRKRVYPHLFRHSYVTHMVLKGVNLVVVQHAVGHSSLSQISQTYANIVAADGSNMLMQALAS